MFNATTLKAAELVLVVQFSRKKALVGDSEQVRHSLYTADGYFVAWFCQYTTKSKGGIDETRFNWSITQHRLKAPQWKLAKGWLKHAHRQYPGTLDHPLP